MILSPKDLCGGGASERLGSSSILGMAGTSILGGGGGGGGGGLNCELPGGIICAKALPALIARMTTPQYIGDCFIG